MLFTRPDDDASISLKARPPTAPPLMPQAQAARPRAAGQTRSVVDNWLVISGNVEGDGELQVDGQVHGNIRCTHLTVGNKATVTGNITADEVVVRGRVRGLIGANRVVLTDGAHVEGDIYHKKLTIEEGACFDGVSRCREHPVDELQAAVAEQAAAAKAKAAASEAKEKACDDARAKGEAIAAAG